MRKKESKTSQEDNRFSRPAMTVDGRESQLIALATDLAEKQLREGTASAQVISHYLKLGSTTEREKKEIMKEQKKLLVAKTEAIESSKRVEELYANALKSMRRYLGDDDDDE